ncbi:MAG: redoxin domain-containing protein [Pirellulaceae bacterium]
MNVVKTYRTGRLFAFLALRLSLVLLAANPIIALGQQDKKEKSEAETPVALIRGRLAIPEEFSDHLSVDDLKVVLYQQVEIDPPPVPDDWENKSVEEQNKWWDAFVESEAGKAYFEARDKKVAEAKDFPVRFEDDGKFVIYDVPTGIYALEGRVDKVVDGVTLAFEVFGRLEVVPETDELVLGDLELAITPLLQNGDKAPDFSLKTAEGETVELKQFAGKPVVLLFWAADAESSTQFLKTIETVVQEMKGSREVELVTVALNPLNESLTKAIDAIEFKGIVGIAESWDSSVALDYGVRRYLRYG